MELARRVSRPAGMALIPAERTLELAERALESAGRPFEASWKAHSHLGGPAGSSGGGDGERETDRTELSWYVVVP